MFATAGFDELKGLSLHSLAPRSVVESFPKPTAPSPKDSGKGALDRSPLRGGPWTV